MKFPWTVLFPKQNSPKQWPGFQLSPFLSFHVWTTSILSIVPVPVLFSRIQLVTWLCNINCTYTWHVAMGEKNRWFALDGVVAAIHLYLIRHLATCHHFNPTVQHIQMVATIPGWSWVVVLNICFIWGRWTHFDLPLVEMGRSTTN